MSQPGRGGQRPQPTNTTYRTAPTATSKNPRYSVNLTPASTLPDRITTSYSKQDANPRMFQHRQYQASSPLIVDPSHGKPNPRLSQPQAPKSKAFTGTKLSIGIHSSISAQDSFHIQSSVGTQPSNNTNNSFGTKSLLNTKSPLGTTPLRDTDTYTLSNLTNLKSPVYTSSSTGSLGYETKHVKIDNPNVRYKSVQRQDPLTEEHQKRELSMIKGLNPKYFNPSEVDRFDRCDICGYLFQKGVSEGFFLKKHKDIFHPKYKVSGAGLGKW